MASIFCPECGAKNGYALKKPNFCQGCGEAFAPFGMTQVSSAAKHGSSTAQTVERSSEGERVPNLSRLEYDIDAGASSKVSFESLVNNPLNPKDLTSPAQVQGNHTKLSKDEFLKVSQAECSSARGKFKDIGGGEQATDV